MFTIRDYVWMGVIASALAGGVYFLQDWHYKPLRDKDSVIKNKDDLLDHYAKEFNIVYSKLYTCENNTSVKKIEGFINGIQEKNTTVKATLTNLHS